MLLHRHRQALRRNSPKGHPAGTMPVRRVIGYEGYDLRPPRYRAVNRPMQTSRWQTMAERLKEFALFQAYRKLHTELFTRIAGFA